jgi:PST family polysaccharide transporter
MNLFKTASLTAIPTVLSMVAGIITNKIMAIYVGPAGVAFLGQMTNFFTILSSIANAGIGSGVVKYAAEFKDDKEALNKIVGTSVFLMAIPTLIITLFASLFAIQISEFLFKDQSYSLYVLVAALIIPITVFNVLCTSLWNAHQEIKKLVIRNIIGTLVSVVLVVLFVIPFGIKGSLIATSLSALIMFFLLLPPLKTSIWFSWKMLIPRKDSDLFAKLLKFSAMSAASLLMVTCVQFFLRRFIGETLSYTDAGIWQSMNRISEMYLLVVTTSLGFYYIPKLSSIKTDFELRHEIFSGYKLVAPTVALSGFLIWFFRDLIIAILYAPSFASMESLFACQMIGDFLKICSWLLGALMISKAMTRYFIATEIVAGVANLVLHIYFIEKFGLIGAPIAYMTLYALHFSAMIFIFRKILTARSIRE